MSAPAPNEHANGNGATTVPPTSAAAPSSSSSSSSAGKRPISYAAERVIGTGSFGVVYQATVIESGDEAKSLRTGESVAIKKVLQDRRFKNRELQIMSMLNHPNLIGLRHCFYSKGDPSSAKDADSLYLNLVMKFVPSTIHRTLRDHAKANRLVPMFLTRLYVWQMCRAVHYIHTIGVCHRDIKPQNVLLNNKTYEVSLCLAYGTPVLLSTGEVIPVEQLRSTDRLISPAGAALEIQRLDKTGVSETMYTIAAAEKHNAASFHSHSVTPHHEVPYRRLREDGRWIDETARAEELFERFRAMDQQERHQQYRIYKPNRALELSPSASSQWFSSAVVAALPSAAVPTTLSAASLDLAAWTLGAWISAADPATIVQRRDLSLLTDNADQFIHSLAQSLNLTPLTKLTVAFSHSVLGRLILEPLSIRRAFLCGLLDGSRSDHSSSHALCLPLSIPLQADRERFLRFLRLLGLHATRSSAVDTDSTTFTISHDEPAYFAETLSFSVSALRLDHTAAASSDLFQSPFDLELSASDEKRYVTFQVKGGLYLLGDLTVTHNCDFGSAKQLNPSEPNVSYICSRYYRAPELVFEATSYTTAIDIWSLGAVFGELLLGSPMFPGNSSVDQLIEIIKILGSPTKDDIFAMNPHNTFRFPSIQPAVWSKVFRGKAPQDALDLIALMLKYDPKARILPLDALAHPFFDPLRLPNAGQAAVSGLSKDIQLPDTLFAFTEEELKTMRKRGKLEQIVPPHLLTSITLPAE